MASPLDLALRIIADTSQAGTTIGQLEGALESLETELRKVETSSPDFKRLGEAAVVVQKRLDEVQSELQETARLGPVVSDSAQVVARSLDAVSESARSLVGNGERLQGSLRSLSPALQQVSAYSVQAAKGIDGLPVAARRGQAAMQGLQQSSGRANQVLLDFSRVVQDAPFGIIGIANNIDPLVQSFGRLRAEGGSLTSVLSVLGGVGGVGLLISGVTSLAIVMPSLISYFSKLSSVAKETASSVDAAAKAVRLTRLGQPQGLVFTNSADVKAEQARLRPELEKQFKSYQDLQRQTLEKGLSRAGLQGQVFVTPAEIERTKEELDLLVKTTALKEGVIAVSGRVSKISEKDLAALREQGKALELVGSRYNSLIKELEEFEDKEQKVAKKRKERKVEESAFNDFERQLLSVENQFEAFRTKAILDPFDQKRAEIELAAKRLKEARDLLAGEVSKAIEANAEDKTIGQVERGRRRVVLEGRRSDLTGITDSDIDAATAGRREEIFLEETGKRVGDAFDELNKRTAEELRQFRESVAGQILEGAAGGLEGGIQSVIGGVLGQGRDNPAQQRLQEIDFRKQIAALREDEDLSAEERRLRISEIEREQLEYAKAQAADVGSILLRGAESFGASLLSAVTQALAKFAVSELFKFLGSVIPGAGFLGAIGSIAARADGGSIGAGKPYLVGERGAELIVPKSSGIVIPNLELGNMLSEMFSMEQEVAGRSSGLGVSEVVSELSFLRRELREKTFSSFLDGRKVSEGVRRGEFDVDADLAFGN